MWNSTLLLKLDIIGRILIKTCRICKQNKYLGEFSIRKQKNRKDGRRSECKACIKDYKAKRYKERRTEILAKEKLDRDLNPEKHKKRSRTYRDKNKKAIKERAKLSYIKNRKRNIERATNWNRLNKKRRSDICKISAKKNPHTSTANLAKRRANKKTATPKWAELDKIKFVYKKAKELSILLGVNLQVDHVIPLQGKDVRGLHVWANLQLLEASLNLSKGNRC